MSAAVLASPGITDHILTPPSTADEEDVFLSAMSNVLGEEHVAARLFRCNALGIRSEDLEGIQSNELAMALIQSSGLDTPLPHDELVQSTNDAWNFKPGSQLFDDLPEPQDDVSMVNPPFASMSAIAEETERDFASTVTADASVSLAETGSAIAVAQARAPDESPAVPEQSSGEVITELVDQVVSKTIAATAGAAEAEPEEVMEPEPQEEVEADKSAEAEVEAPGAAGAAADSAEQQQEQQHEVVENEDGEEKALWWAKTEAPEAAEEATEAAMEAAPAGMEADTALDPMAQAIEADVEWAAPAPAPAPTDLDGQGEAAAEPTAEAVAAPLPSLEALLEDAGGGPYPFVRDVSLLDVDYDRSGSTKLGEGANGTVSTLTWVATGETRALKTMAPTGDDREDGGNGPARLRVLLDDVSMQKALGDAHAHIATVHDVFVDPATQELLFVMPLAAGGAVPEYLAARSPPLDERGLAKLVSTMLSTVAFCHEQHVVHRDIKLENFVFASPAPDAEVMLIDFGMAVRAPPDEELEEGCSTLFYQAPEMQYLWHAHVLKTGGDVKYNAKVDVWAMGLIAYQLLYGVLPFGIGEAPEEEEEETIDRIVYEPLQLPDAPAAGPLAQVSAAARAFCERLLQRHPDDRPTAAEALSDPWLLVDQRPPAAEEA